MDDQLDAIGPKVAALTYALVPGRGVGGERASASTEAALPASLDALSLTGAGSDEARCLFVPKVRTWAVREDVVLADGETRSMTVWRREPVRDNRGRAVLVLADDQVGVLPVRSWLTAWELDWRHEFDQRTSHAPAPRYCACGLALTYLNAPFHDEGCETVQAAGISPRVLLGIGARPPDATVRVEDPVAQEWQMRWDPPAIGVRAGAALSYLRTHLGKACESHPRINDFAASLRTLTGALRAATGDILDLHYLGRCPEPLIGAGRDVCGAALWHDPRHATITCPRCRTETHHSQSLRLARQIRHAFPAEGASTAPARADASAAAVHLARIFDGRDPGPRRLRQWEIRIRVWRHRFPERIDQFDSGRRSQSRPQYDLGQLEGLAHDLLDRPNSEKT